MDTPERIELALELPGLPELDGLVRDFGARALDLAEFPGDRRNELLEAFMCGVDLVERTLSGEGDAVVPMEIGVTVDADAIEFRILEHGIPLGSRTGDGPGGDIPDRIRPSTVFDRLWWVQKGQEGSELHLRADRDHASMEVLGRVRTRLEQEEAEQAHADVEPSDRTTEYRIRDYRPGDGLSVARRIYEAYGRSYPNPDLYVPERIDRLNAEGRIHSIICESDAGDIVGHYALERPDLGPIGEAGQAVIDHRHRGHGLMKPMRAAVEKAGADLGLLGIWSQPTARHPVSQRMNIGFGSTPCALCLGTTPAGATLRGGVKGVIEDEGEPARHSCFLYWDPIVSEPDLVAHVPEAIAGMIEPLYEARGRRVVLETDPRRPELEHETIHSRFDSSRAVARISTDRVGTGSLDAIRAAIEAMENSVAAATIFIDLPIDDPGCCWLATELLAEGLRPAGIGPRFRIVEDERRAEDVLRLQANPAPVDFVGLVVEGSLGRALADTVLGDPESSTSG
ncbi:MAG: hypothetical protein CMJ34_01430 [Phycisphaerae bacterium]|nr:hypothetical protein [Phycisphaerae bacterium]